LVSWVENSSGSNVTINGTYSTRTTVPMSFLGNADALIGSKLRLNISTSTGTLESVDTNGEWTPN